MHEVRYKQYRLDKIIDFSLSNTNGSFFTKTFINNNKGSIPVYGASNDEKEVSYGYVKDNLVIKGNGRQRDKLVKYFEDCLTWNIDGSVAVFYRRGRFSLSEKVIPLIPFQTIRDNVNLEYIRMCIIQSEEFVNFNFDNKGGRSKLGEILIKMPVNDDDTFNIKEQNRIATFYKNIEIQKEKLKKKRQEIKDIYVTFNEDMDVVQEKITDLFTPVLGDGKYTKEECIKLEGQYPVYSGNTVGCFAKINEYTYKGEYLTWAKDGLAGYIMHHNEEFSITNHRGILIPKEKCKDIDLRYIKVVLEPIFRNNIKGRLGVEGKNEYTTLSKDMIKKIKDTIPIPVKKDKSYDLEMQRTIADKYERIEEIKKEIVKSLEVLINTQINID